MLQSQLRPLSIAVYGLAGLTLFVFSPIEPYILPASLAFCSVFTGLLMSALAILSPRRSHRFSNLGAAALIIGMSAALYTFNTSSVQPQMLSAWLLTSNRLCLAGMLVLASAGLVIEQTREQAHDQAREHTSTQSA